MVHVAREMKRTGMHAAAADRRRDDQREAHGGEDRPGYDRDASIHVLDASRSVGVVEKLINPEATPKFDAENRELQEQLVASYAKRQEATLVPYAEALRQAVRRPIGRRSTFRKPAVHRRCDAARRTCRSTKLRDRTSTGRRSS